MIKRGQIFILVCVAAIIILSITFISNIIIYSGKTLESRQKVLERELEGTEIISEVHFSSYIISQIKNNQDEYGFAFFEPLVNEHYGLQTIVWRDNHRIATGTVNIYDEQFELFMCNEKNLVSAKVTFQYANDIVDMDHISLLNGMYAIVKTPRLENYNCKIVFIDNKGNIYE